MNRRKFFETAIKGGGALAVAALLPGMTGQDKDAGMWEVWADDFSVDDFSAPFYVFLDGKDLEKTCIMFYGSKEPGVEVEGYVEIFSHDPVRVAVGVSKPSDLTGEQEATDVGFYPDVVIYPRRLDDPTFDITLGEHHTHLLDADGDSHSR